MYIYIYIYILIHLPGRIVRKRAFHTSPVSFTLYQDGTPGRKQKNQSFFLCWFYVIPPGRKLGSPGRIVRNQDEKINLCFFLSLVLCECMLRASTRTKGRNQDGNIGKAMQKRWLWTSILTQRRSKVDRRLQPNATVWQNTSTLRGEFEGSYAEVSIFTCK